MDKFDKMDSRQEMKGYLLPVVKPPLTIFGAQQARLIHNDALSSRINNRSYGWCKSSMVV
jgi:hypothetical protein